jgi:NodT family efflux transporter outer membrane factor (OMF) lipoprotein
MIHVLLLGCFLVISACTAIPVKKRAEIPPKLPQQFVGKGKMVSAKPLLWKQSFPSRMLKADVEMLLEQNLELEAARARVNQAAAVYGIESSALIPELNVETNFDHSRVRETGTSSTSNIIDFKAALHWELDIWGRLHARKKAASLLFEEQQALAQQTALDMQTLLVESWVIHHAARKLERVLSEQRKTNEQFLYLTELRLAQGQGNALDVLQQRGLLVTAERELSTVNSRKQRTANTYAVLMGRYPDGVDLKEDEWPILDRLSTLTSPNQLLSHRPDLRAAFLALRAADHEVAAAIADRLPRLSLELSYEVSGSSFTSIGDGSLLSFVSGLLAPIFNAGRLQAKVAQRQAEAREALAVLEQAMLEAVREVEDALIQEQTLFRTQNLLGDEIAIAKDTVDKATLRYVNGQESFLAVLVALVKLQTLQQKEISLQQELLINRSRLLKALGAKWS